MMQDDRGIRGENPRKKEKNEDKIPRKKDARPGLVGKKEIGKKM